MDFVTKPADSGQNTLGKLQTLVVDMKMDVSFGKNDIVL